MKFILNNLTEENAKEICSWKYEGEYAVYNYPDWNVVAAQNWAIAKEEKRCREFKAVLNESGELCGYFRMIDSGEYILVGVGLKPSICGNGLGSILMKLLKNECFRRFNNKKIVLEVRSFNKRAIKCYEKAGFTAVDSYERNTLIGSAIFIKMEFNYKSEK